MSRGTLLVTGANGFTGRHLIDAARARGWRCVALVQGVGEIAGVDTVVQADLTQRAQVFDALASVQPDAVVHLAAIAHVAHGDLAQMYGTNVVGTANLLDALIASAPAAKVLVASSANIYGNARQLPIGEDRPPSPENDYAVSKLATEQVVRIRSARLPVTIVRPFNYTGAGQAESFLVPKLVAAFRRRDPALRLGNLDVARDFSDVRDVVEAYLRLLDTDGETHAPVFNVASGRCIALRSIVERLAALTGHAATIEVDPALVRGNEIHELYGTDARLQARIGDYRSHDFDDTLRWMLAA